MSAPLNASSESDAKPLSWQAPAAVAVAAGLVVGKKSVLSLALGVAAVAGARWWLGKSPPPSEVIEAEPKGVESEPLLGGGESLLAPLPTAEEPLTGEGVEQPFSEATGAEGEVKTPGDIGPLSGELPPVAATFEPAMSSEMLFEAEPVYPTVIYQQPGEMLSCNAAPESMVWFAMFNDAPQGVRELPPAPDAAPQAALLETPPLNQSEQSSELPETFFSEAPEPPTEDEGAKLAKALTEALKSVEPLAIASPATPTPAQPAFDLGSEPPPLAPVSPVAEPLAAESELPADALAPPQVIAKPVETAPHCIARPTTSSTLPQRRAEGETPKAWVSPVSDGQAVGRLPKGAGGKASHRSILPHEALGSAGASLRWFLVVAVMVLFLTVAAVVVVTGGWDGDLMTEFKQRWLNLRPAAATAMDGDSKGKVGASPTATK